MMGSRCAGLFASPTGIRGFVATFAAALTLYAPAIAQPVGDGTPLIPRYVLFKDADRSDVQISPDGTKLAWMAASDDGPANIWIAPLSNVDVARQLTDSGEDIDGFGWMPNGEQIVFMQDGGGDENFHIFAIAAEGGEATDLTPFADDVRSTIAAISHAYPDDENIKSVP